MSRLDDTSRCPLGDRCESCGERTDLAVTTAETPVGVYCLTSCGPCGEPGRPWSLAVFTAVDRVLTHCGHLGIDADAAAELLEAERRP